jgi:hypothetical protein
MKMAKTSSRNAESGKSKTVEKPVDVKMQVSITVL